MIKREQFIPASWRAALTRYCRDLPHVITGHLASINPGGRNCPGLNQGQQLENLIRGICPCIVRETSQNMIYSLINRDQTCYIWPVIFDHILYSYTEEHFDDILKWFNQNLTLTLKSISPRYSNKTLTDHILKLAVTNKLVVTLIWRLDNKSRVLCLGKIYHPCWLAACSDDKVEM